MNIPLRIALIKANRKIYEVEREAKLPQSKLSKIIHQVVEPTEDEKERLAKLLRKPVSELFATNSNPVHV